MTQLKVVMGCNTSGVLLISFRKLLKIMAIKLKLTLSLVVIVGEEVSFQTHVER